MEKLEITNEVICELTALAYRNWAYAADTLKAVKAEQDDKSPDWFMFHGERLRTATAKEIKARYVLDSIRKYCYV